MERIIIAARETTMLFQNNQPEDTIFDSWESYQLHAFMGETTGFMMAVEAGRTLDWTEERC